MDTLKCIISKANSIRFAHIDGNMPSFDNTLSFNEVWYNKPTKIFDQIFFSKDTVLLQVKAGLTATVVVTKFIDGVGTVISSPVVTTYAEFKIYEYLIAFSSIERGYLEVESEESLHRSECFRIISSNNAYYKYEWSSNDILNDSFEFDYTTILAETYVNFMRLKSELGLYKPTGKSTIYDNQNEKVKLKSNIYRQLQIKTDVIPRQIAEIIVIAMQHDLFLVNQVGYTVEDLPNIELFGGSSQLTATLTLNNALGLNTHDIGYNCDAMAIKEIENFKELTAGGTGQFTIPSGFGITQIRAKKLTGTPRLKVGSTPTGDEIFMEEEIVSIVPPAIINLRYDPDPIGDWICYYNVTGGTITLYIQSIIFEPH